METFPFSPLINLSEEGKWLLAVTSFEPTNSVFNITAENNAFSFSKPSYWSPKHAEETIIQLNELSELGSHNDIELHYEEVGGRGTRIETENSGYGLAGFDHIKVKYSHN